MSVPLYTAYRDSGVPWIGHVPSGWQVARLKTLADVRPSGVDKHSIEGEVPVRLCNYVDVYKNHLITAELAFLEATATPSEIERFTLAAGDVLITKDSETPADIAAAALVDRSADGVVCGYHLALLRPAPGRLSGAFLFWSLKAAGSLAQFSVRAQGITRFGLTTAAMGDVLLAVRPPAEQRTIAAFLDREAGKIDALVAEQERLIALLKEKRQSVISHAVTKGLDPNAPMKDSDVAWLGQVPAHWEMVPLMWLTQSDRPIMYGIVLPGPDVGEGVPILKGGNVRPSRMNLQSMARTTPSIEAPYARARLREGDLVYSIRGSIGDCEIVPAEPEGSNITQDVARVAPTASADGQWLRFALLSDPIREELASGSLGAAVRGINIFDLKRVRIPTPPEREQHEIADHLIGVMSGFDALTTETTRAIALLKERRAALISAAVTGKIDVRGLVAPEKARAA